MPTTNNVITQNLIENLGGGGFGFGVGVILYDNFYAAVTDNVIDTVRGASRPVISTVPIRRRGHR